MQTRLWINQKDFTVCVGLGLAHMIPGNAETAESMKVTDEVSVYKQLYSNDS